MRLTLKRPAGISICLPPRLPEREGYYIQPERAALQKSIPIESRLYIRPKSGSRAFPP